MSEALKKLQAKHSSLESKRKTFLNSYNEIKSYLVPDRGRFLSGVNSKDVNNGELDYKKIVNSRQRLAMRVFASGLHSGITPKSTQWYNLITPNIELMKIPRVAKWTDNIEQTIRTQMFSGNSYDTFYNCFWELGSFGTAPMMITDNNTGIDGSLFTGRSFTAGEYCLDINADLQIDTFYRVQFMTARQMVEYFSLEKVSQKVADAYKSNKHTELFQVIQAIEPNDDRLDFDRSKFENNRPFRSIYFEVDSKDNNSKGDGLLRVRGYEEFPVMCPRFQTVSDDIYGTSPAFDAMPDIKMLQRETIEFLTALQKVIRPPVSVQQGSHIPDLSPGAVNFETGIFDIQEIRPLFQIQPDLQNMYIKLKDSEEKIKETFYNDLFSRMSTGGAATKRMTSREVELLNDEKIKMISPVLDKFHYELLNPFMKRIIAINERNGLFERFPIPPEVQEAGFTVKYSSSLLQAQKTLDAAPIERSAAFVASLAQFDDSVLNIWNSEEAMRQYSDAVGLKGGVLRSTEELEAMNKAAAQKENQMQQMGALREGAETAKVMNDAVKDNPLIEQAYTRGGIM